MMKRVRPVGFMVTTPASGDVELSRPERAYRMSPLHFHRRTFLTTAVGAVVGCGAPLRRFPFDQSDSVTDESGLTVDFYGVTCFRLKWHDTAVLVDPFWTYLPLLKVGLGQSTSDPEQVDPYLDQLGQVESVLVGHSHYDHVMDLPYVTPHLQPNTKVFCNQTLVHTLAPLNLPLRYTAMNAHAADEHRAGPWFSANRGKVRVMAISSGHPNNYAFFHMWPRHIKRDRKKAPTRASHFQEGMTLAFLVDFLQPDGITVAHRVYVQTSSRGYPDGFFPKSVLDARGVDVALLGMDCANIEASGTPSIIDFIEPKTVLFCHWENFFRKKNQPPREIVKVDMAPLKAHFDSDDRFDYRFPGWDTRHFFPDPES